MFVFAVRVGVVMELLVVIFERDGVRFFMGVFLDGVDFCRRGELGFWYSDFRNCFFYF